MVKLSAPPSPDNWIRDVFACAAVQDGLVVRREILDIERNAGIEAFLSEVQARGFQAVENRGQIVVFCSRAPIRVLV